MKRTLGAVLIRVVDLLLILLAMPAALVLKAVRRIGLQRLRGCAWGLLRIGVLPIRRHYYEPFLDPRDLRFPLDQERALPGIDWNIPEQLALLDTLRYENELSLIASPRTSQLDFRLGNGTFESGDAEFLYQLIRAKRPRRVFEIGSGNSTLIARAAIAKNRAEMHDYSCKHLCVEPFEAPWLETADVIVLRRCVEEVEPELFAELEANDLLFIDSTHVIRPQGDVVVEYLEILPRLRPGVIVHAHDIFSPRDYLQEWIEERLLLWDEQYLLEAFLTDNRSWKVIGALNLLRHRHFDALQRVCPYLTPDREPGSFYMQRVR